MRAIVTGATGFVGANLARRLLKDGHEVHLFLRSGYTRWRIDEIRDHVQIRLIDINDSERLAQTVKEIRPDWIFHLAAYGAYPSQVDVQRILQTNILGTVNLVQACLKAGFDTFVNTGSSSEYGFKDHAPSENELPAPNSHYAVAKVSATMFCQFTARNQKVRIPTLRLYSAYGPFEEPTRLLPRLIALGIKGSLPPLADPSIARDFVYVDDVLDAYLMAANRKDQALDAVYNVGSGTQTSLKQVVDVARRVLNIKTEPVWGTMKQRTWDTNVWVADSRKIRQQLGWQPHYDFESGFVRTVKWFRENLDRYRS